MWKVEQIFDGDYGCEERQEGESKKVSVYLVNELGETKRLTVEDAWLLEKEIDEGSVWPEEEKG